MASISNLVARDFLTTLSTAADVGTNAVLKVYSGSVPANADTALSGQTVLAELNMSATAFNAPAAASPGNAASMTAQTISDDTAANAAGTPTFCRIEDGAGDVVCQLTAGLTGSGQEVIFASAISLNATVSISSLTITQPLS